jgi:hypothetical protein
MARKKGCLWFAQSQSVMTRLSAGAPFGGVQTDCANVIKPSYFSEAKNEESIPLGKLFFKCRPVV